MRELQSITNGEWNRARARHLLNRAGFGAPYSAIGELEKMTPAEAVSLMVDYERQPADHRRPDFLSDRSELTGRYMAMRSKEGEDRAMMRQELFRMQRGEMARLQNWWVDRMINTQRPLEEKLTLFWHSHFATSAQDVKLPEPNYQLNQIFRENASGNFRTMVFEVGKSEAMLKYLNNRQNRKNHPNENWARELMELFTLGIGNYTEQDVKEAARAFTGYTERQGEFVFVSRQHDYGEKTFLGKTGNFDGKDIVDIIFEQPECARFISRKLWEYFVYDNPSDELVEGLAKILRDNDYEMKPLLRTLFSSQEFYSEQAMAGQVKSPAQYVVMLQDHLKFERMQGPLVVLGMRVMGQTLFYPPNVKGWDGNRGWITTNTLLARYNIPGYLLTGNRPDIMGRVPPQAREIIQEMMPQGMGGNGNTNGRRRQMAQKIIQRRVAAKVREMYQPLNGQPAGQAVDQMTEYLLGRPIASDQRAELIRALTGGNSESAPFLLANADDDRLSGTLHLILSMSEYQLC